MDVIWVSGWKFYDVERSGGRYPYLQKRKVFSKVFAMVGFTATSSMTTKLGTFSLSSLHRWYVECKLWDILDPISFHAVNIVRCHFKFFFVHALNLAGVFNVYPKLNIRTDFTVAVILVPMARS